VSSMCTVGVREDADYSNHVKFFFLLESFEQNLLNVYPFSNRYYSTYGHVGKLAEEIEKGASSVEGVEVKLWQVSPDHLCCNNVQYQYKVL
jgi:hypothetical protein